MLSERMGVRERGRGRLLVSNDEFDAACEYSMPFLVQSKDFLLMILQPTAFYHAFCFYKV